MFIKDCTETIARQMAATAVNASIPVGMGFLHYNPKTTAKPEDIEVFRDAISIDYYEGRMTKFHGRKVTGGWEFTPDIPNREYQSWCIYFKTYEELYQDACKLLER